MCSGFSFLKSIKWNQGNILQQVLLTFKDLKLNLITPSQIIKCVSNWFNNKNQFLPTARPHKQNYFGFEKLAILILYQTTSSRNSKTSRKLMKKAAYQKEI